MASKEKSMDITEEARSGRVDLSGLQGQVHVLREKLQATREESARVERAPVPLEEAYQRLTWAVDNLAEYGCSRLEQLVGGMMHPQNAAHVALLGEVGSSGSLRQAEAVISYVFREQILGLGRSILEKRYQSAGRDAIPCSDRPRILAELEAETFALEVMEEALIEQGESAGLVIHRRPNATPEAVLGISRGGSLPWDWSSEKYDRILLAREGASGEIESIRQALRDAQAELLRAEKYANEAAESTVLSKGAKNQAQRQLEVAQERVNKWRRKMAAAQDIVRDRVALATALESWVRENTQRQPACQGRPETPPVDHFVDPIRPSWRPE